MAQVYSVNAVGYVNLSLPAGFSIIANPLNNGENKLSAVIPTAPEGATLFKFTGGGFDNDPPIYFSSPEFTGWFQSASDVANYTLKPGEGVFISLPSAQTMTFVGEVPQGTLTTAVPTGFSLVSSQVPQASDLTTLGFSPVDGDTVYQWLRASQSYDPNPPAYFVSPEFTGWFPGEAVGPTIGVGEGFFVSRIGAAGNWTRTFSVNN